jgi:hypothetical protein
MVFNVFNVFDVFDVFDVFESFRQIVVPTSFGDALQVTDGQVAGGGTA